MARLKPPMEPIAVDQQRLAAFGQSWIANGEKLTRSPPLSSTELGDLFDEAVAKALAGLLGNRIISTTSRALIPPKPDCVEVGDPRIVGGIRTQHFDVVYRPDGVRFAHDTKTLNDRASINKNWRNMVNDLATEATTVHSRFPHAVVSFLVVLPRPALTSSQEPALIETLERLAQRSAVDQPSYFAEAIALVLWDPSTGSIDPTIPAANSPLRIERFSPTIEAQYVSRYKGLPPHAR